MTYTLVLIFLSWGSGARQFVVVPGFQTETACVYAADHLTDKAKPMKLLNWSCEPTHE